jgi:hypothetical protein
MNIFKAQACPLRRSMLQATASPQACLLFDPFLAREHALLCGGAQFTCGVCVWVCVCVARRHLGVPLRAP